MAISRPQINRQLRKDGGILTIADARRMAPPGEDLAYINKDEAALLKSLGGAGEDINGTGIKSYFIKKVFKKAAKAVKKVVKSPVGKAAILGALTFGIPGTQFSGLAGGKGLGSFFGKGSFNPFLRKVAGDTAFSGLGSIFSKAGLVGSGGGLTGLGKLATIGGISGLGGLLAAKEAEGEEEIDFSKLDRGEGLDIADIVRRAKQGDPEFRFLPSAIYQNLAEGGEVGSLAMNKENVPQMYVSDEAGALPKKMKDGEGGVLPSDMGKLKRSDFETEEDYKRYLRQLNKKAEGGMTFGLLSDKPEISREINQKVIEHENEYMERTGKVPPESYGEKYRIKLMEEYMNRDKKAEGGIMDLGGMEMDLRGGGFVPLGAKEKADDVPARLSKNEFVMTADAVRAAGGGSIDKGADKMYNLMKDLESRV